MLHYEDAMNLRISLEIFLSRPELGYVVYLLAGVFIVSLCVLQKMDRAMSNFMMEVHKVVSLAIVSGSDLPKIVEQLGENLEDGKIFDMYK